MTGSVATATTYVGRDRRQRRSAATPQIRPRELAAFAGALVLVGLAVPTALARVTTFEAAVHTQTTLRMTWSMLFVSAGVLQLVRWRLTGESREALLGCGLFCFGSLSASTPALASLMVDDRRDVWLSPATRMTAVTAFLVLVVWALRSPPVDAGLHPLRVVWQTLFVGYGVVALFIAAHQTGHGVAPPGAAWFVVGCLLATGWLVVAAVALTRGAQADDASATWIGLGLTVLAAAQLLHALAFVTVTDTAFYATGLNLVVAGVALGNAARDLGHVLNADGTALLELRGTLDRTEQLLDEEDRQQRQRLHDARSLIAALKMASETLERYDERLETAVKQRLRSSLVNELTRLEQVIDGRRREPLVEFELHDALAPLLVAERQAGFTVREHLGDVRTLGRPLELATVVQHLLINARRRAPESVVRVRAERRTYGVSLIVEDRRPGVRDADRDGAFDRRLNAPGRQSGEGNGIDLYLARRLVREQGGDIELEPRPGGGARFVITLPAASDTQVTA